VSFPENQSFYTISNQDAHAYPEVFLNGAWVRFEPTVGGIAAGVFPDAQTGTANDVERTAYAIFYALIAVLAVAVVILRPKFMEAVFRLRLSVVKGKRGKREALRLMFARICSRIYNKLEIETDALTVFEVADIIKPDSDIEAITKPLSGAVFGDEVITDECYEKAYECYKTVIGKIVPVKQKQSIDKEA
jgi:hypothetical protein